MYTVSVTRNFIARHFLVGGDWGPENELNSHHYRVDLLLEGPELDRHGFLVDIIDIEANLDRLVERYRDVTLNDLREFKGLNPSIEHFSRIFWERISKGIKARGLKAITVKIWEDDIAWASYRSEV